MNPICFYHKSDLDGVCSAAIVRHFVPDCELCGLDYGDEFPWDKSAGRRTVYMVDFSLKPDNMKRLDECSDLVWLDHHKSAVEACLTLVINGIRDTLFAACELCWMWFSPDQQPANLDPKPSLPKAIRLLGRYDCWDKNNPEWSTKILPFQYAIRADPSSYIPGSSFWQCEILGGSSLDGGPVRSLNIGHRIQIGRGISAYLDSERQEQVKRGAFEVSLFQVSLEEWKQLEGVSAQENRVAERSPPPFGEKTRWLPKLRCICLNTQGFGSASFDSCWDPERHDVMVAFAQLKSGKWRQGLYSTKPTIDCSCIAKAFGGGGHRGAAGCETEAPIVKPVKEIS